MFRSMQNLAAPVVRHWPKAAVLGVVLLTATGCAVVPAAPPPVAYYRHPGYVTYYDYPPYYGHRLGVPFYLNFNLHGGHHRHGRFHRGRHGGY